MRVWPWQSALYIDEDVPCAAGPPLLDLRPHVPYHAGPEAGLQDQMELVSDLPARVDVRHGAHPHAGGEDGRPLQVGPGAARGRGQRGAEAVVSACPAAEAGLLPLLVLAAGGAHGHVGERGVRAALGTAGRRAGGAGAQCFPIQERLKSCGNLPLCR